MLKRVLARHPRVSELQLVATVVGPEIASLRVIVAAQKHPSRLLVASMIQLVAPESAVFASYRTFTRRRRVRALLPHFRCGRRLKLALPDFESYLVLRGESGLSLLH